MTAPRRFTSSPWRLFAAVAAAALVLMVLERSVTALVSERSEPGRGASWIWAQGVLDGVEPLAFFAVRDFELDEAGPASLTLVADEEYVAYVNGRRVGSGAYRGRLPADRFAVGDLLKAGGNRLAVELRSSRGAGGLLAHLRIGDEEPPRILSGGDWRIFRRYEPAILLGWDLEGGEPAAVWHRQPTGRWRPRPPGEPRSWHEESLLGEPWRPPQRARSVEGAWHDLTEPRALPELGPRVIFDWGEEITGVLHLELATDGGEPGLLFAAPMPPDDCPAPADGLVVPVPGRGSWSDAFVRTFRYICLVGVDLREAPEVEVAGPAAATAPPSPGPWPGIFGVQPPRDHTYAEEQIRERLFGKDEE